MARKFIVQLVYNMEWLQLTLTMPQKNSNIWSEILNNAGALAITIEDAQNQPIFEPKLGTAPLWDTILLIALFDGNKNLKQLKSLLINTAKNYKHIIPNSETLISAAQFEYIKDQNWQNNFQDNFKPMLFGNNLWIYPAWCPIPEKNDICVKLSPGLAFGTGTHPTTALCLEWLANNITPGTSIIDYGCGSGILGIAAAKLGAAKVYSIDHDPQALESCQQNSTQNNISSDTLSVHSPDSIPSATTDIVIANILANPLLELAPIFTNLVKPSGQVVLSGILENQISLIKNCYKQWFKNFYSTTKEEWALILCTTN